MGTAAHDLLEQIRAIPLEDRDYIEAALMREAYEREWHAKHDPTIAKEPLTEQTIYTGDDWDDLRPHLWTFFDAVRTRKPNVEDAVFGNHAAIACHMANESYFRKKQVRWDAASNTVVDA